MGDVMKYRDTGKRILDLAGAGIGLVVLSPLYLVTSLLVFMTLGRPVVLRQKRAGRNGRPFTLYKFRTMTDERDALGNLLPDEVRLHPVGRLLRSTSMDELPGLINVLRGEMSLVGPRPLFIFYNERYSAEQRRRLDVKPGITGWAQVNGRNAISWEEKFAMDGWYAESVSLELDLRILALTVWKVLRRQGISQPGLATAEYFGGPPPNDI